MTNTATDKADIVTLAATDKIFVDDASAAGVTKHFTPLEMSTYVGTLNLSNLANAGTSRTNLGVGSGDSPTFAGVNLTGMFNLGTPAELTIATGVVTATGSYHTIDTEADASSDTLDTINGGTAGDLLIISSANDARDVTVSNSTGNIEIGANFTLNNTLDTLTLIFNGTNWVKLSNANNAV